MTSERVGRALVALLAVLVLGTPLAFVAQAATSGPRPHEAVLAVAGPILVAQAIAERADALPGRPFDARVLPEGTSPRASIADGTAQLGLTIDFRLDHDLLAVSTTTDPDLVAAYQALLEAVGASYGRTLSTQQVPPSGGDGAARGLPYVLTLLWVLAGLALAVGLSLWRGPVASTTARGAARLAWLGAGAVLLGVVVAVVAPGVGAGETWWIALLGALVAVVTSWSVLALESLLGLGGLALGVALLVGLSVPLLTHAEPSTLPAPWSALAPWTPHGAALQLARRHLFFAQHADLRSWAVLLAWAGIAIVVLIGSRLVRPAALYVRGAL